MTPRERLFRAVNLAHQLSVVGLILVVLGFFTAYSYTLHGSAAVVYSVTKNDGLPATATSEDYERQEQRFRPVREAAHRTAVEFVVGTAACIGAPVAILLTVSILLLNRARSLLRQGV